MDNIENVSHAITKALAYTENGGAPNPQNPSAGKTGEMKSIFQFTPDTWKHYAGEIIGDPNAPLTPDSETYVVSKKVENWLQKGYKPEQIASMWNAGQGEPDAYGGRFSNGQPSVGVNKKYGVHFDVPAYAKKVTQYTNKFLSERQSTNNPQNNSQDARKNEALQQIIAMISQAKKGSAENIQQQTNTSSAKGLLTSLIPKIA